MVSVCLHFLRILATGYFHAAYFLHRKLCRKSESGLQPPLMGQTLFSWCLQMKMKS